MTTEPTTDSQKRALRQQMRARRRALSPRDQARAASQLARQISRLPGYKRAHKIAVYLASDGEIALTPLIRRAAMQGKRCYLPRITGKGAMDFHRYRPGQALFTNTYGLAEPGSRQPRRALRQVDIVLLPLVAFDRQGGRLGMGGGFYDRALTRCRGANRPLFVGVAHDFQEVGRVPTDAWDIPLDWLITPQRCLRCARPPQRNSPGVRAGPADERAAP